MKRNIFSVLLVCLMIVSICVLSGCKVDELEAQVNENASAAEGAVSDAISKAEGEVKAAAKEAAANLAAAQEELEKLIADGAAADADALEAAVENFNAAIADVEAAMAAAEEAAKDNNDAVAAELAALKAELTTAVEDASKAVAGTAAQELAAVKAELLAAIAESDKDSAANISAAVATAVENLTSLIATVQKTDMDYADALKKELDDKFTAVAEDVAKTAAADLEAATALLKDLIAEKADTTTLDAAAAELQGEIDALVDVLESLTGDKYADLAEIGNLKAYIAAEIASAKAVSDAAYIVIADWNAASDALVAAVEALGTKYYAINRDLYYAKQLVEIDVAYDTALVALSRVIVKDDVAGVLADAVAALEAVDTKAEVIYAVLTVYGTTVDEVVRNDAWNKAITDAEALLAAETDADVIASLAEVQDLATAFRNRYDALAGNAADAALINDRIKALIDTIKAEGFTANVKSLYTALKGDIAAWDKATGDANAALIDRALLATLDADYDAAKATYDKAATDMKALLESFTSYTYGTEAYKAVTDAKAAYDKWLADITAVGFDTTGEVEKATAAAYDVFAAGVYARALALEQAVLDAADIIAAVEALTDNLNGIKAGTGVVRSQYQADLAAILAARKTWLNTYFSGDYAAEAVDGNVNYAILNHQAVADVEALYNEVMAELMALAEALKGALAEIKTIDVFSGADLAAASAAYTKFTDKLGDLGYDIDNLDDAAGITNTIASKTVEFKALVAEAVAAYEALNVTKKADVLLTSAADIDALVKWYKDYVKVDLKADGTLAESVVLSKDITINDATVADAKAAIAAFDELTAAKKAEFDALKAEIDALVALAPSTALRDKVNAALANYKAWFEGANAPAGYKAAQFVPADTTALDTEYAKLQALDADVKDLEAQLKALLARVEALVVDYKKLNTAALQADAQTTLDTLKADIATFTANNDKVDCFADSQATLAKAQLAIDQAKALSAITAEYDALIAKLAGLDPNVVANMTARAKAALAAAVVAIENADETGMDLAYANFDLFDATIDEYVDALAVAGADDVKAAKVYEAYVLLDNRIDMVRAAQLADELRIVAETFEAVLA